MSNPSPNDKLAARVRAAYRARACAAAICVGTQIFALGAGLAMTASLNAAYLSALASLPMTALVVLICHHRLRSAHPFRQNAPSRILHALAALTLTACAIFGLAALVNLGEQSLLPQARAVWIASSTLLLVALGALSGGTGAARLSFALRFLLPAALPVLVFMTTSMNSISGLFPLLGPGIEPVLIAALGMTAGAAPALMLLYPPPEVEKHGGAQPSCPIPGAGFFLWRVLLGAGIGVALLTVLSLCNTYESIRGQLSWGERMRILCSNHPQEGVAPTALILCQMIALVLLAINMLCAAQQALEHAFPALKKRRMGLILCVLLCMAALGAMVYFGFSQVPRIAGWLGVPLILILLCAGRM